MCGRVPCCVKSRGGDGDEDVRERCSFGEGKEAQALMEE